MEERSIEFKRWRRYVDDLNDRLLQIDFACGASHWRILGVSWESNMRCSTALVMLCDVCALSRNFTFGFESLDDDVTVVVAKLRPLCRETFAKRVMVELLEE